MSYPDSPTLEDDRRLTETSSDLVRALSGYATNFRHTVEGILGVELTVDEVIDDFIVLSLSKDYVRINEGSHRSVEAENNEDVEAYRQVVNVSADSSSIQDRELFATATDTQHQVMSNVSTTSTGVSSTTVDANTTIDAQPDTQIPLNATAGVPAFAVPDRESDDQHFTSMEEVTSRVVHRTLKHIKMRQGTGQLASAFGNDCHICADEIKDDHIMLKHTLPCQSRYHASCALQWFRDHATCPHCRAILRDGEQKLYGILLTGNRDIDAQLLRELMVPPMPLYAEPVWWDDSAGDFAGQFSG